ncbi:MAG: hypothetical protein U0841_04930 [Chloroflexia bacterium]
MYVVVREVTPLPGHEVTTAQRDEAEALTMVLAGFHGQLTVDIGDGKHLRIAVWTSAEERASNDTNPAVQADLTRIDELYSDHVSAQIIGRGEVVSNTLLKV